jgi:hypothetical protein
VPRAQAPCADHMGARETENNGTNTAVALEAFSQAEECTISAGGVSPPGCADTAVALEAFSEAEGHAISAGGVSSSGCADTAVAGSSVPRR